MQSTVLLPAYAMSTLWPVLQIMKKRRRWYFRRTALHNLSTRKVIFTCACSKKLNTLFNVVSEVKSVSAFSSDVVYHWFVSSACRACFVLFCYNYVSLGHFGEPCMYIKWRTSDTGLIYSIISTLEYVSAFPVHWTTFMKSSSDSLTYSSVIGMSHILE